MQPDPGATIDAPPTTTTATGHTARRPGPGHPTGGDELPVGPRAAGHHRAGPMIGLLAPFAGRLVDRLGRLRILTGALVVYAVFGTAPLWLPSLPLIRGRPRRGRAGRGRDHDPAPPLSSASAARWPAPTGVPSPGLYRGPPGLN
jgi:hypothetical protein